MQARKFLSVNHRDIFPATFAQQGSVPEGEFFTHEPIEREWGALHLQDLVLPNIRITRFDGKFRENIHLGDYSEAEPDTVNSCFGLEGAITSEFSGFKRRLNMCRGLHNFIYKPEIADNHYIEKADHVQVLHVAIDRLYYAQLLSEEDRPCALLKENLMLKRRVAGPDQMHINAAMQRVVYDILHCTTLTGNLRNIWMEGKMLELIAYQLHQYLVKDGPVKCSALSKQDREAFFALKKYLGESFTEPHSLTSLSRNFGLNEFKLKKGFKELFGTTVFEHLHELKMNYARMLLRDSGLYVNEVANRVGYKNPNHFSSAFKKQFGISPKEL